MAMTLALELCIRLVAAGVIGAAIGYERELRGKEAGIRTHFLVSMGACLFMIVSQYGFLNADRFDAARVAAGVVGGLGFLGGGIIMKTRHVVGLTTAAGIWVTGAIGLALGGGMYEVSVLCVLLLAACMEGLHFYSVKMGERQTNVVLSSEDYDSLKQAVASMGKKVTQLSWVCQEGKFRADISLLVRKRDFPVAFLDRLRALPGVTLESMD